MQALGAHEPKTRGKLLSGGFYTVAYFIVACMVHTMAMQRVERQAMQRVERVAVVELRRKL